MTIGGVSVCDVSDVLHILSLALTAVALALALAWWDRTRASIICLALSVLMQSVIAFTPTCASIIDVPGMPVVGGGRR
jgi:hypothetical protein